MKCGVGSIECVKCGVWSVKCSVWSVEGRQVPRLPRKVPRHHRRPIRSKRATRPSTVSPVARLPRKTKRHVAKCHACHAKRRHMSPSATPATQSAAASPATNPVQARHQTQPSVSSTTPATQNEDTCRQVPRLPHETQAKLCVKDDM